MNALVVRVILSLIIFFSLFLSSNLSVADDKNVIELKKIFKVQKIDFGKKISGHTSTLLSDGKLLIIGGRDDTGPLSSILIYDASINQFKEASAKLITPRFDHTATILSDNKILIAGGSDAAGAISLLEIYDPVSDTIASLSNNLSTPRSGHTATLLSDGRVLITGGTDSSGISLDSAEVFDPNCRGIACNAPTQISQKMTTPRSNHTVTLMPDGRVIIIGGDNPPTSPFTKGGQRGITAEVFNPSTETFTSLSGQLKKGRFGHSATLLPDGRILIALGAGYDYDEDDDDDDDKDTNKIKPYNNAELYDPITDTFTKIAGKITDKRYDHTANLLTDARIIIIGGEGKKKDDKDKGILSTGVILTPIIADNTAPNVSSITINNNPPIQGEQSPLALIRFSEPTRVTTLRPDTILLKDAQGAIVEGIIAQSESGLLSFFTPKNPLSGGKGYTIELTSGITDTSGNPITAYTNTFVVPNPVPSITSISPVTALANTTFTITIKGTGFVQGSIIKLGGYAIPTTYTNETEITGNVPASAIKTSGNYPVIIENPSPGGGTSNAINLEIKAAIDIKITSPPDNISVSIPNVSIEGSIISTYPITEIKVWGLSASITGNTFSAPIIIAPGANTITITAKDTQGNQASATINVTLLESPPPTGANIKGYIHGQVYHAITKQPISDAEIIAKGLTYKVTTDANGKYTLPVPEEGGYQIFIEKAGYVTAMRQAYVIIGRETVADTAYLTPFDTKAQVIRAATGGTLTDTTGMVEVIIPPNALPYDMPISATYMPTEETFPIPMPYGDNYIAGVQFTPEYVTFNQPVTIRIRNTLGFAPGTPIPYAYASHDIEDQNTGFYDPGMGVVTADGLYIEYQLPHFSCMASTLPGPGDNPPAITGGGCEGCKCGGVGGSCTVLSESGDLLIDYFLPSYKLLGQENGLTLLYNSSTVYQYVPIRVKAKPRPSSARPDLFKLNASFGGGGGGGGISVDFLGIDAEQDFRMFMVQEISSRPSLTTGVYYPNIVASHKFSSTIFYLTDVFGGRATVPTNVTNPNPAISSTKTSYGIPINNQIDSPFGAGWNISGYERLHINPDGNILLIDGVSMSIYKQGYNPQPVATKLRTPSGIAVDASDMVYVADSTDGIIYSISPSGDINLFSQTKVGCKDIRGITMGPDDNLYIATGYHRQIEKVTQTGERSFYTPTLNVGHIEDVAFDSKGNLYVVDGGRGQILKITPDRVITIFASGFINPISITVDKEDNLYVTNNNNTRQQARCGVSYISKIDPAGNVSTHVSGLNAPMGVTIDKSTGDLYVIDTACADWRLTKFLYRIRPNGLKELISDKKVGSGYELGLAFDLTINSKGELFSTSTTAGTVMSVRPNTTTYQSPEGDYSILTKETDGTFTRRLKDGTTIKYNSNGLMTSKTDRNSNTYTYTHDGDRLTSITDPMGQTTTLNYSGGYLSSITDPFGRTTTFAHNGKNLTAITGPDGSTTQYNYDDRRLLTTKTLPGNKTYQYGYDQYGKIRTTQAPTGETRQYLPAAVQQLLNNLPAGTGTPDNPAEPPIAADIKSMITDGKGYTRTIKTDKTGVIEEIDPLGRIRTYIRDAQGNPLQIRFPDGNAMRMSYDANGNLKSRTNQINNTTRYTYESTFNQITSITEPRGDRTNFSYDAIGNLKIITDALQNATNISYNARGLISSITDAQNNVTQYSYNTSYQLEAITDALNNTTRFTYDNKGNITSITDAKGNITIYEYDVLDRLIKVTDPAGNITTYAYNPAASCDCGAESPSGNIASITDANGNITRFEYNPIGQLTKITDPLNDTKTYSYDMNRNLISITDAKGSTINYDYDAANRQIKKTTAEGVTDYAYNLVDNLTTATNPDITYNMGYDAGGRNTSVTSSLGKTLNYGYDANGNRTNIITGGANRSYDYDFLNRLTRLLTQLATTNIQPVTYTYDSLSRRTRMFVGDDRRYIGDYIMSLDVDYLYDQLSRLTGLKDVNSPLVAPFTYTYDELGRRTSTIALAPTTSPSAIIAPSNLTTDIPNIEIGGQINNPAGNNIQINNNPVTINSDNTFTMPLNLYSGNNNIKLEVIEIFVGRTFSKDININLTTSGGINAPNTITVQIPRLKISGQIDNPQGWTIRINGNDIVITTGGTFSTIQNLQWGQNNINIVVTNPSGQSLTKQITATYDPAGGRVYADNIAIHPITHEVYGIDLTFSDPARITKISTDGVINTVYTLPQGYWPYGIAFSPNGELYIAGETTIEASILKLNPDGTTTTIATGITVLSMAVDANNNIYVAGGANLDSIYKIAPDGATTTIATLSTGIGGIALDTQGNIYASAYNYGIDGAIYKIAPDGTQTVLTQRSRIIEIGSIAVDNNGDIYTIERGYKEIIDGGECVAYRVLRITAVGETTIVEECDESYATNEYGGIGLDAGGNIIILGWYGGRIMKISQSGIIGDYIQPQAGQETVEVKINVMDMSLVIKVPVTISTNNYVTKTYNYDNQSRLTSVMRGVLEEDRFSYDGVGNRLTDISGNTYSYSTANELLNYDGITFTYDLNGNMTSKTDAAGTTRYTYNSENQLIRVELPNGKVAEYKYDPFGRRIEKSITDTATGTVTVKRYVYDREDILFELDANGNIITEYVHGPGIDEPIAMIRGGKTYYYHADALGSIIAITDSYGRVVQRYEYNSFGEITYQQDPNFVQPYTYTGREYDQESGLYYYRARYYDAKVGRFVSQDPILFPSNSPSQSMWLLPFLAGNPNNLHQYVYVVNAPLDFTDPLGLLACGGCHGTWEGMGFSKESADAIRGYFEERATIEGLVCLLSMKGKPPKAPKYPPGKGWEWKGSGPPESGKGNYVNPNTGEQMHPHPESKHGPHVDYTAPDKSKWRVYPDGKMEPK